MAGNDKQKTNRTAEDKLEMNGWIKRENTTKPQRKKAWATLTLGEETFYRIFKKEPK